jgi:hypothetical protein
MKIAFVPKRSMPRRKMAAVVEVVGLEARGHVAGERARFDVAHVPAGDLEADVEVGVLLIRREAQLIDAARAKSISMSAVSGLPVAGSVRLTKTRTSLARVATT